MDREEIIQRFEKLRVWKRAGERAPHKPLLVLYAIGKLLRGEGRLIPYSEVDTKLGNLLREFGPKRANYRPKYPFWHLQTDKVWEIPDATQIFHESHGDVRKDDLLHHNVSGGFPENIARTLQKDSKLVFEIIQRLLNAHFPSTLHEDILTAVGIEYPFRTAEIESSRPVSRRKGRDPNFRSNILRAYEYKCAVCSFDVRLGNTPVALEAAHIRWHQAGGPDELANGLALCSLHHKLFDRGAFTLSNRLKILVSDDAHGSVGFEEWLLKYHGTEISFPQRRTYYPQGNFIGWHVKEVFKGEYREL